MSQVHHSDDQEQESLRKRVLQEASLAVLAQRALVERDVSSLLQEAVTFVTRVLETDYCEILELLPDGMHFVRRAGHGWMQTDATLSLVSANTNFLPGYTLLSEIPVIFEDLSAENRFRGTAVLDEHRIRSGFGMLIYGKRRPFGMLGGYTLESRSFSQEEIYFFQTVANTLATAIERFNVEKTLQESEERLRWILHATNDVFYDWDLLTGDVWWNEVMESRFGYSPQETDSMKSRNDRIHPEDRDRVDYSFQSVMESERERWAAEYRFARADGSYANILDRAFVIRDHTGRALRVVGVMTDLTTRKSSSPGTS